MIRIYSQDSWIILKTPQSDIIGKSVEYSNGDINVMGHKDRIIKHPLDISIGVDEAVEFNEQFKKIVSPIFNRQNQKIIEVKAKKILIKSLSIEDVKNMESGNNYVYSGLTADSVEISMKLKKESNIDISVLEKTIQNLIKNDKIADVVTKLIPVIEDLNISNKDSIIYKFSIANPNIFYKVKIIEPSRFNNHNWERYYKSFYNPKGMIEPNLYFPPPAFKLIYTPLQTANSTSEIYPEFWGSNDNRNILVRLTLKKVENELKLFIQFKPNSMNGSYNEYEVESKIVESKKYWVMDRKLIYNFEYRGRTKLVYVQVKAEQISPNEVKVTNWDGGNMNTGKQTFMQYPEIKFKYLKM